ncbi:hypothetical protein ACQY1Q_11175 [Tenacibaculum sp. TC6]|uniref:hypothetical protein n=1 Tax=Tenacibaculum sp. TC6 TaxID=3423223 RepID=UPI003D35B2D6
MYNEQLYLKITLLFFYIWHIQESVIFLLKLNYRVVQGLYRVRKTFLHLFIFSNFFLCLSGLFFLYGSIDLKTLIVLIMILFSHLIYFYFFRSIIDTSDRHIGMLNIGLVLAVFQNDLGMIFIGVNTLILYFFTGYNKLLSFKWRTGKALREVMNTKNYGHEKIADFLESNKKISLIISWSIIVIQLSFCLAIFNKTLLIFYITIGFLFHLCNLVVMRLHSFFLAFLASYPSIIFLSSLFQK